MNAQWNFLGELGCNRFHTLEDWLSDDTGNAFQGSVSFLNLESDDPSRPAATGYGIGLDDVVVQWREFKLDRDATDCATSGRCATLDLKTTNFFQGSARLGITATETTPYGNRCVASGSCTISGDSCSTDV